MRVKRATGEADSAGPGEACWDGLIRPFRFTDARRATLVQEFTHRSQALAAIVAWRPRDDFFCADNREAIEAAVDEIEREGDTAQQGLITSILTTVRKLPSLRSAAALATWIKDRQKENSEDTISAFMELGEEWITAYRFSRCVGAGVSPGNANTQSLLGRVNAAAADLTAALTDLIKNDPLAWGALHGTYQVRAQYAIRSMAAGMVGQAATTLVVAPAGPWMTSEELKALVDECVASYSTACRLSASFFPSVAFLPLSLTVLAEVAQLVKGDPGSRRAGPRRDILTIYVLWPVIEQFHRCFKTLPSEGILRIVAEAAQMAAGETLLHAALMMRVRRELETAASIF